jgi:uncharacterized protein YlzI (FlbEa/FlbD family)
MAESVGGFVKVSTAKGPSLYLNPHHVTAVEAGPQCTIRLHDGSQIVVAENAEELVRVLEPHLSGRSPRARRAVGLRRRMRRRGS